MKSGPDAVVSGLLAVREVFDDDLRGSDVFRDCLVSHLKGLL